ncbi:MAG: hypothetical protein H7X95_07520 [Deltaproteobacteria bacterium]|nr:hypothetical protein [Deltaproteobacteria bacterium]
MRYAERILRTRFLLVLVGGVLGATFGPTFVPNSQAAVAKAKGPLSLCSDGSDKGAGTGDGVQIWIAPQVPTAGRPLRVMAVAADGQGAASIVVTAPGGRRDLLPTVRRGGAPWSYDAVVATPAAGPHTVTLIRDNKALACRIVDVAERRRPSSAPPAGQGPRTPTTGTWTASRAWDRSTENFYSAWVESLFDAPASETLGFRPLAQALRDRDRNFFYDYLALGEDDPKAKSALIAAPDCADLPYFLRAYFSWKMGLPFGMRDCDRGTAARPPRCGELITNETPVAGTGTATTAPKQAHPLVAVKKFLRLLANKVHSGSGRTALGDENTDYYPTKLTREALRPGAVFADPYGHVLMVVKWVAQTPDAGGILLAVDGQPDGSIGRKRFWEGTFLYANDVVGAGPGFKMFRPLVRGADGKLVPLSNAALRNDKRFTPFSTEQQDLSGDAFYARMGKLINPKGLDAAAAHRETLDALVEQLETRIGSVDNGEKYMRENNNPVAPMPEGPKIFETIGPWEDYATPSRDMRLQIAMHVLETLPARIVAHPELFNLGSRKPETVRGDVEKLHAARISEKSIEYRRSDGSSQRLTVADLLARKAGLEMAYNPNDCVEIRWGAPEGSPEASTCKRRAPDDQRARMAQVRSWFHDMRRPAR